MAKTKKKIKGKDVDLKLSGLCRLYDFWVMRVKSSNILQAAYDPNNCRMVLIFKTAPDCCYIYEGVEIKWWAKFSVADSKGEYFQDHMDELVDFTKMPVKDFVSLQKSKSVK